MAESTQSRSLRRRAPAIAAAICVAAGLAPGVARAAIPGAGLLSPVIGVPGNIATPVLTHDGLPDLVVPLTGTGLVSVRLADDRGGFGPPRRYKVGLAPSFIAVGDFARNGNNDLAVSNAGTCDVSVLRGRGDGTFFPAHNYSVSGPGGNPVGLSCGTFSLEAADVNGDGVLDLVTVNSISNDVSVLLGRGDGTFRPAVTYRIPGPKSTGVIPFALSVGEFDGDSAPDLVVGGAHSVTIMENDGHGRFTATSSYFVGLDIACTKVADLLGNGKLDIVATGTATLNAQVLLGNGDGTFMRGVDLFSGGFGPQCFSIGDVNRDGHPDLAIVNSSSPAGTGDVAVELGDGHGNFRLAATYPVGMLPWASSLADFAHRETLDLAVANTLPPSVSILRGNGDGTFRRAVTYGM
jgi:hypothetical protein